MVIFVNTENVMFLFLFVFFLSVCVFFLFTTLDAHCFFYFSPSCLSHTVCYHCVFLSVLHSCPPPPLPLPAGCGYRKLVDCPQLLDVDDMVKMREPDWKCVYTYLQEFYRGLVTKGLVKTKNSS